MHAVRRLCRQLGEYWAAMRVLLTGADGFIGGHLARGLCGAGHELVSAVYGRAPGGGEVRVDLTDAAALDSLPGGVEAVVNAAGIVDPTASRQRIFAVNLGGTRNLLGWARATGVRHFVQLSSVAVYGGLLLGEDRSESTPRLGAVLGLPYMRSKALAERAVEQSGVSYSLLRPPAVLGAGDTVLSAGFHGALMGTGIPLVAGANPARRVSLSLVEGLVDSVLRVLARGPLGCAIHAVDAELSLGELAQLYAAGLGRPCNFARSSWLEVLQRKDDAGFAWLVASARFGQHYSRALQVRLLGQQPVPDLKSAVLAGVSGLHGIKEPLF